MEQMFWRLVDVFSLIGFLMFCGMFFSAFICCLDDITRPGSDSLRG